MLRNVAWRPTAVLVGTLVGMLLATSAVAHHGWGWATDELTELTGEIIDARLGNPHGEVTLSVDGEQWLVEVGQPWRNERAGLTDEMLSPGRTITVVGNRSAREDERLLKAVRVIVDGQNHDLYPGRLP